MFYSRKYSQVTRIVLYLLFIPVVILITGCSERTNLTPYPFKDGDYFVYQKPDKHKPFEMSYVFRVESKGDGFVVRRLQVAKSPSGETHETQIKNSEKIYDQYGRLQKLADGRSGGNCRGNFCFLWLRPEKRKVGAEIKLSEIARTQKVSRSVTRNNRELLVVEFGNSKYYYDKTTGLLKEREYFGNLIDTNRKDLL